MEGLHNASTSPWASAAAKPVAAAVESGQLSEDGSSPPTLSPVPAAAEAYRASRPRWVVSLMWVDERAEACFRNCSEFAALLAEMEQRGGDAPLTASDDNVTLEQLAAELMTHGEELHHGSVDALFSGSVGLNGCYTPPLFVTAGELAVSLDERVTLEALLALIQAESLTGEPLQRAVDSAQTALDRGQLETARASELGRALVAAYCQHEQRKLLPAELTTYARRMALEQGAVVKRFAFGAKQVRALLYPREQGADGPSPMVAYVPEQAHACLPLFDRFDARLIVRLHLHQDEQESLPYAVEVLAIAQVVTLNAS